MVIVIGLFFWGGVMISGDDVYVGVILVFFGVWFMMLVIFVVCILGVMYVLLSIVICKSVYELMLFILLMVIVGVIGMVVFGVLVGI